MKKYILILFLSVCIHSSGQQKERSEAERTLFCAILEKQSQDEYLNVRVCVAYNKNTSPKLLQKFSTDGDVYVRMNVARNLVSTMGLLEKLLIFEIIFC